MLKIEVLDFFFVAALNLCELLLLVGQDSVSVHDCFRVLEFVWVLLAHPRQELFILFLSLNFLEDSLVQCIQSFFTVSALFDFSLFFEVFLSSLARSNLQLVQFWHFLRLSCVFVLVAGGRWKT